MSDLIPHRFLPRDDYYWCRVCGWPADMHNPHGPRVEPLTCEIHPGMHDVNACPGRGRVVCATCGQATTSHPVAGPCPEWPAHEKLLLPAVSQRTVYRRRARARR